MAKEVVFLNISDKSDLIENNYDLNSDECAICSDNKREILLKPCNHMIACESCSSRCKKCLICKETIKERIKIEECLICAEKKATILLEPCGHMCTCEGCSKLLKKCIKCRVQIDKQINFLNKKSLPDSPVLNKSTQNIEAESTNLNDVKKLQQQLQDIKEQVNKNSLLL